MANVGNYQLNFNTNVAPIEQAMAGLGTAAETTMARIRAIAQNPVNIPIGLSIQGENRLNQIIGSGVGSANFLPSGRISPESRESIESQIRRETQRLADNDQIRGPGGGANRSRAQLEQRRQAVEQAAITQANLIIAEREAYLANEVKINSSRTRLAQIEQGLRNNELLALEQTIESRLGEANLRKQNIRNEAALDDVEGQARAQQVANRQAEVRLSRQRVALESAGVQAENEALGAQRARNTANRRAAAANDAEAIATRTGAVTQNEINRINARLAALGNEDVLARGRALAATQARVRAEQAEIRARVREGIERQRLLQGSRVDRLAAGGGFGGGLFNPVARAGGAGSFLGGGLASTLRFGLPSALLFGAASGISSTIRQAEELEQIFVRLESQFESLGQRGIFGGSNPEEQAELATAALDAYREELFAIARATGLATDETAELGQKFIGLFSSIEGAGATQELAEQATRITAEFAIITGLNPEETFNDLAGSVRSFGETGREVLGLIDQLTDSVVNVADATGVSAGEITDFVGRIGPAAAQAGLELNEIIALGATALQGSGVGGAALAEQFSRVLTGLQGELGTELSRLAIQFEDVFSAIELADGTNVADLFSLDNISSGNVDQVLIGLINGFDELTESQQRQIVASVGSRREGATLAAVLQNAATFSNALEAATDANGQRQERFGEIIERLTGQFSRLRAEFVQFGLDIFNSGLADILSGLIASVGTFIDAANVLVEILSVVGSVLRILPDGFTTLAVQLGVVILGVRLFSGLAARMAVSIGSVQGPVVGLTGNIGLLRNSIAGTTAAMTANVAASGRMATAQTVLGRGIQAARGGITSLASAIGPLNAALAVGFIAFSEYNSRQEEANAAAEAASQRQEVLGSKLSGNNDIFDRAAVAAQNYADSLKEVASATSEVDSATVRGTSPLAEAFDGLEGDTSSARLRLAEFLNERNLDLAEALEQAVESDIDGNEFLNAVQGLNFNQELFGSGFLGEIADIAAGNEELVKLQARTLLDQIGGSSNVFLSEFSSAVLNGDFNQEEQENIAAAFADFVEAERTRRADAEAESLNALLDAVDSGDSRVDGFNAESIRAEIERRSADSVSPGSDFLFDLGFFELFDQEEAVNRAITSFETVREQFESGFLGQAEFFANVESELDILRQTRDSQLTGTDASRAEAAETEKLIRELEEVLAEGLTSRLDADIEIGELIGSPIAGDNLRNRLLTLATDVRVQGVESEFVSVVTSLLEAEQQVAIDAISRAETLEAAQALAASLRLSPEASRVFTRLRVGQDDQVGRIGTEILGIARSDLPGFFDDVTDAIEASGDAKGTIRDILLAEVERLSAALALRGPRLDVSGIQERLDAVRAELSALDSSTIITGSEVGLSEQDFGDLATSAEEKSRIIIERYEELERVFEATGQDQDLGSRATRLVQLLRDPEVIAGSEDAVALALTLAEIVKESQELTGAELEAFNAAITGLTAQSGQSAEELAVANVLFQLLAQNSNAFNTFMGLYVDTGSAVFENMLRTIAALVAAGVSAEDAVARSGQKSIEELRALAASLRARGRRGDSAQAAALEAEIAAYEDAISNINDNALGGIPNLRIPTVSAGGGGGGGGSSSSSGNALKAAVEYAIALREAQFDLLEAQIGNDEVALAELEVERAQFALDTAVSEVDKIRALADKVRAESGYWSAINDVFQAQNDLAIAVAESFGDFEGAFELGVNGAQAQLDFLIQSGAGAAEIAQAQIALIRAQTEQERGLTQLQLDELGFLFDIGDLSTSAYIASLQKILAQLDPVSDVDLWRQITLQIKRLEDSSKELQFNLPDSFSLPTLYEVRRVNQANALGALPTFGSGLSQQTSITNDSRNVNLTINVQTGMDWEEAREVIGEAVGADQRVFSLSTRRY